VQWLVFWHRDVLCIFVSHTLLKIKDLVRTKKFVKPDSIEQFF